MHLFYASHDGHTRAIAERIAARLGEKGIAAVPQDLGATGPAAAQLAGTEPVVVLAAVRYGKHLPAAERFLAAFGALAAPPPLVLLSVNLTARKEGRDTLERCTYLKKSIRRCGLRPVFAAAFAGKLDYARCNWRDRQLIRMIMWMTGGPTDTKTCIDYTDWDKVDAAALAISKLWPGATRA